MLEESLRIYPPSAFAQARVVPPEGAVVCGEALPPGTSVGVATLAAATSSRNWRVAGEFRPERWLDGEEWEADDRKAMQPFLVGAEELYWEEVSALFLVSLSFFPFFVKRRTRVTTFLLAL